MYYYIEIILVIIAIILLIIIHMQIKKKRPIPKNIHLNIDSKCRLLFVRMGKSTIVVFKYAEDGRLTLIEEIHL